tara:strand:- start:713 stop:823 length:111 start_codon:yes stop_codon:yes gene_type:complete
MKQIINKIKNKWNSLELLMKVGLVLFALIVLFALCK